MVRLTIEGSVFVWKSESLKRYYTAPVLWEVPSSFLEQRIEEIISEDEIKSRVEGEDLSDPVLVWDNHVLTGGFKVCKALSQGHRKVWAVVLKEMPSPEDVMDTPKSDIYFRAGEVLSLLR